MTPAKEQQEAEQRIAEIAELRAATANLISVIEQLIPEPSARGVAEVVLLQARAALALGPGGAHE